MSEGERRIMSFTAAKLLALIATILFVLAAFGVAFGVVSLIPLGLAFLAAAFVVN
jgi:F0F1-type ATP synthase assembly protein I